MPDIIDYIIVLPIYKDSQFVNDCINSIEDKSKLLVVDNSEDSFMKKEDKDFEVIYEPKNMGLSRAWNIGAKRGHDWTFVLSVSMKFPNGFSKVIEKLERVNNGQAFITNHSFHCSAFHKSTFEKIGYFDENFYPIYYEDTDYYRRIALSVCHGKSVVMGNIHKIDAISQADGYATTQGLRPPMDKVAEYYVKKWGGKVYNETFDRPFDKYSLKYFPKKTLNKIRKEYV